MVQPLSGMLQQLTGMDQIQNLTKMLMPGQSPQPGMFSGQGIQQQNSQAINSREQTITQIFYILNQLDQQDDGQVNGSVFQREDVQKLLDLVDDGVENKTFQNYLKYLKNPFEGANPYDNREGYNVFRNEPYNVFKNTPIKKYKPETGYKANQYDYTGSGKHYTVKPDSITDNDLGSSAAKIALSQLGANERDGSFLKYTGGKNEDWCAHFASWAYEQANGGKAPWGHQASVSGILDWGKKNDKFISKEQAQGNVKVGDVVIYKESYIDKNGKRQKASHTGRVTKINDDGSINTVEGNTKDAVREQTITLNNKKLSGFVRANG